ncbi:hypothetical protein QS764_24620, partial [Escherichia coli]|nr:hypothetical protein [Escherichia coli]
MFKPLTALTVGLSLALSGAALAKEKIDFMFPAPVDGKLTMEMTRVIKQGTVAKLAMRQPFVLFKGLTFQKLCLPGAFRPGDHHNK